MGIFSYLCQKQMESVSITYFSRNESSGGLSPAVPRWGDTLILGFAAWILSLHLPFIPLTVYSVSEIRTNMRNVIFLKHTRVFHLRKMSTELSLKFYSRKLLKANAGSYTLMQKLAGSLKIHQKRTASLKLRESDIDHSERLYEHKRQYL